MLPVIAIVGRPNVGKSTLFNCLSGSRDALVADEPGLTRDRHYRVCTLGHRRCVVVDTGGLSEDGDQMSKLVTEQTLRAHRDADVTFFVVDARDGLTAADEIFAARLRRVETRILLVVNKTEGLEPATALSEFHRLGLGDPWPVAAAHGRGVHRLVEAATEYFAADEHDEYEAEAGITVAIIGRPNVGKSTLVNRILGEERVVAHDMPGTTRDSIHVPFQRFGRRYTLIDTAGIRRRARVSDKIEKFSILKSLQSIEAANVVVLMLDAREGVTDQDASLLGMVVDSGRALLVALNKWDNLTLDQRRRARASLERKLAFVDFASIHFISALHGSGVGKLFDTIDRAWESASRDLSTSVLTRILIEAIESHAPPLVRGRRIKLRYAHQGGKNPPCIVVHGNQTHAVPDAYRRYLVRTFRRALKLKGTPIRIEFKTGENPYKGRKNVLSDRQRRKRKRLMRHVRG